VSPRYVGIRMIWSFYKSENRAKEIQRYPTPANNGQNPSTRGFRTTKEKRSKKRSQLEARGGGVNNGSPSTLTYIMSFFR